MSGWIDLGMKQWEVTLIALFLSYEETCAMVLGVFLVLGGCNGRWGHWLWMFCKAYVCVYFVTL